MVGLGCLYLRKKRMAGSQSPVALTAISLTPTKAPESLAALLAACGLEHHASAFEAEGYTLETLLDAVKHGEEAAMRDLRELKLNLGDCRKIVNQLKTTSM